MSSSDSLDTTTTNESDSVKPTTPHYTSKFSSLSGFGMKILGKYGFQAGEGLGKNKDGIKDHVTTSKKYHQTGIGIGSEKEKKPNYWWENSYNQMLDNIAKKKSSSDSDSSDSSDEEEKKKKEKKEKKKEKKEKKEKKKEKKEKKKREEEESEEKSEKKEKKSKKRSKKDSSDSDSSSSDEEEKSSKKTKHCVVEGSSVLQADFFKECEGRTLKKYRQEGKESRAKKHEEELVAKLKEAKEKMEAFNQQRKFKHVVTEKRKIQQNKVKVYRDFGDQ